MVENYHKGQRQQHGGIRASPWKHRALVCLLTLTRCVSFCVALSEPEYFCLYVGIISVLPDFTKGLRISREARAPFPQYVLFRDIRAPFPWFELSKIYPEEHVPVCLEDPTGMSQLLWFFERRNSDQLRASTTTRYFSLD